MFLLDDSITHWARETPSRVFVIDGTRRLTFREFDETTRARSRDLQRSGVARGDRVVVLSSNSLESVVACGAVLRSGGILVPVSPDVKLARLLVLIEDCAPSVIIASRAVLQQLLASGQTVSAVLLELNEAFASSPSDAAPCAHGSVAVEPTPCDCEASVIDRDVAAIIYTSGSSGEPKGVMLTHANVMNSTAAIARYLQQDQRDVVGCAIPIAFSYGLFQVLTALRMGSQLVLERSFVFPLETLRSIAQHRVTMLPAVPTMIARLIDVIPTVQVDLSSLRVMTNAAAALPPAHVLRLTQLLSNVDLHLMYGQTECTRACSLDPSLARTYPGSVGRAIPNSEVYLRDDLGRRLVPGVGETCEGELVVRGANVMRGYWRKPRETAACLIPGEHAGETVLKTGDRFRVDSSGLFSFVARADEVFKCRGEKIAPSVIEHALCEIAGVSDAAVTGVAHEEDGMAIHATIVVREGCDVTERAVRAHCRSALESAFMPRFIEFKESLPRTSSGKLLRRELVRNERAV